MADLEDRHADSRQRHEIALDLFEDGSRQHRRAGGEVEDAMGHRHSEDSRISHEDTKAGRLSCTKPILRVFVTSWQIKFSRGAGPEYRCSLPASAAAAPPTARRRG